VNIGADGYYIFDISNIKKIGTGGKSGRAVMTNKHFFLMALDAEQT
jgi:hypothetical protein